MDDLSLELHPEARRELRRAVSYYRTQSERIAESLIREVRSLEEKLLRNPLRCGFLEKPFRCCRLDRFPFGIVYGVESTRIRIVAFMHLKRRPGYWKDRVGADASSSE